jgi:DnaJ-class molecular chaperone
MALVPTFRIRAVIATVRVERNGDDLHCRMPIPFTTAAWRRD